MKRRAEDPGAGLPEKMKPVAGLPASLRSYAAVKGLYLYYSIFGAVCQDYGPISRQCWIIRIMSIIL